MFLMTHLQIAIEYFNVFSFLHLSTCVREKNGCYCHRRNFLLLQWFGAISGHQFGIELKDKRKNSSFLAKKILIISKFPISSLLCSLTSYSSSGQLSLASIAQGTLCLDERKAPVTVAVTDGGGEVAALWFIFPLLIFSNDSSAHQWCCMLRGALGAASAHIFPAAWAVVALGTYGSRRIMKREEMGLIWKLEGFLQN